ncbi:MAG: hypothetical protein ACLFO1_05145 [Spirochaetaceae bacterium]
MIVLALGALAWTGVLAGCATPAEEAPEEPVPAEERPPEDAPAEDEPKEPMETPKPDGDSDDAGRQDGEAEEPQPEPEEPAAEPEDAPAEDDYEVTEEVYNQTFSEVEKTIEELNKIIREQDFEAWRSYLTKAYADRYSDPEELREISDMPILQRNEITLRTLRDYFRWVVVPSRANARLDDLRFISENEVEAIMSVNGRQVILYHLKNVDGSWKIDTT